MERKLIINMLTRLTLVHLDLFLELKANNPGQWKMGSAFEHNNDPAEYYQNVLCNENAYTIGYIEGNRLLSIGSMMEIKQAPSWHLLYYSNIKTAYSNFEKTKGNLVYSELFKESFRRKLGTCLAFTRDDHFTIESNATGRLKEKVHKLHYDMIPELKMFMWVDEACIPPNSIPKYEYQQWLMGYKTYPFGFRIRLGILKQEHRQQILFS